MSSSPPPPMPPPAVPPPPRVAVATTPWGAPDTRPGDDHRVDLTLLDAIALVGWSLLGQLLIAFLVGVVASIAGLDTLALVEGPSSVAFLVVVQSGVLAGALAWLAGRRRLTWRLTGSRRFVSVHLLQGLGFGLLAFGASFVVSLVGTTLTGSDDTSGQSLLDGDLLTGPGFWLVLLVAGLLAPTIEELTFRGALFQVLGRRTGLVPGLLLSSFVFAVVHVEVLASGGNAVVFAVALFVVGVVFAWAFNRSRNLVVPIVAHATFNTTQLVLARLAESS